ncbi:MAG: hypothetical protein PF904_02560 [Kiritimatiellae bacterium]|jgi:hypothetical protein|nr:hypothetical protein [Kiritimatiellia bacterium]
MGKYERDGMTILELVIASMLLGLMLTCAFPLIDSMMGRIQVARDHYIATTLCQARIERARQMEYDDIILMAEKDFLVDEYGNRAVNGRYKRTTIITPEKPEEGMTEMIVEVKMCICSRWGWRRKLHPLTEGKYICRFGDVPQTMTFLFTEYDE